MKESFAIAVSSAVFCVVFGSSHILTDEFVSLINSKATTWTARRNFENYTTEQLVKMANGVIGNSSNKLTTVFHEVRDIPDTFDSRNVWPECESIRSIRNQGECGSCWAFATTGVMSDRLCIFSAGQKQFNFSPEELISCCEKCYSTGGCNGGIMSEAFNYWIYNGIPSGGTDNSGCRPYSAEGGQTPDCNKRCVPWYNKDWQNDIRHGIAAFEVTHTVEQIQHEIVINGPVAAGMVVYEDFFNYGSGIYQHTHGNELGMHAVKIIGWGNENGVPYWTVANSWGTGFGEGGFFRILRGSNTADIENDSITAGNPNTSE